MLSLSDQAKNIGTLTEGATYDVPKFSVNENGPYESKRETLMFCKGNKADETALRQEGFFTETLIAVAKKYLEDVNVGPMATRETSMAITKLDEALMWIRKRADDRAIRNVQGTYQK